MELWPELAGWFFVGLLLGGIITALVPDNFLPLYLGGEAFNNLVLSYNLPYITKYIMTLAMVGIVSSALMTILILPPRPPEYGKWKHVLMVLQWPLLFVTIIIFGSLPGLDAQTRLMLGKYMGFWVTPKSRK